MRTLAPAMTVPQPLQAVWPEVPKQKRGEPVIVRSTVASTFVAASTAIWHYLSCQEAEMSSLAPPIRSAVDPGPPPVAPNLADPTTRLRLTPAAIDGILKLAEIWRLTSVEACALLGDISERTWFRMKKGERARGS